MTDPTPYTAEEEAPVREQIGKGWNHGISVERRLLATVDAERARADQADERLLVVLAQRDALQEAVRRLTAGYELTHHSDGAIWWRRDGWLHATPAETEAVVAARRALDASPTEGTET